MRKVRFKLLNQSTLITVETDARTFGELKEVVTANKDLNQVIKFGNNQFIDRDTQHSFGQLDNAILPVTDCILFIFPLKTDSGCNIPTAEDVKNMSYKELRTLGSTLNKENGANIDLSGKRDDICERILDFVENGENCCNNDDEEPGTVEYWCNEILYAVNQLKKLPFNTVVSEEPVAIKVTLAQLEEEALNLQKNLKK